jgi:hypothetical protein
MGVSLHLLGVFKINSHPFFPLVKLFLGLYIQAVNKKVFGIKLFELKSYRKNISFEV